MLARRLRSVNETGHEIDVFQERMLEFSSVPASTPLETFPNPRPGREFEIAINCPEFTSVCPKTGLPDFGEIRITYVPGDRCIELKSLKYYMIEFRNRGIFYEAVTNQILDDLVAICQPRRMTVVGDFSVRGGIKTVVTASYVEENPKPADLPDANSD
jgi:7-cyano-7-deazaguanine reductase